MPQPEAVILIGIPATGKSTFYKQGYADTHVRINGDMLGNKGLEQDLIEACLKHRQSYVVDKMNFTQRHRQPYIERARLANFRVVGYYFRSVRAEALARNKNEDRREKNLPDVAIRNAASKLELPKMAEGFDALYYVRMDRRGGFACCPWEDRER
jgi:predicted kinase